ncbi:hypothetical protein CHS0354_022727 [Potamilus streckersoni]|uniref:CUB domain-containing protein n=1 Tax=Potamilus streckersoni TaxID=2493646 RepID=A0AAE0RTS6_9BIVA|nr:hypothetical protein CHS0354_022727 [Potamilus streckersoni]
MVKKRIRSVCVPGCDHLRIFEADQPYHSTTQKNYFAEESGFIYESISARLVILHCMSNGTYTTGKMFKVLYEVIDKVVKIQGTVTSPSDSVISGNITSPNFPQGYALNGETFTYMIQNLDPYGHIRLTFDDWDLAEESEIQVYDDLSGNSRTSVLHRGERPILVSNTNTLVLVFNVGEGTYASSSNIGFKATYYLVAGSTWADKPLTNCSSTYLMQSGGIIKFSGVSSRIHQFYDCVWTIKRYIANNPDGVIVRIDKIILGDGWLHSAINVLDINNGLTSIDPLIGRYVSTNITVGTTLHTSGKGLYIRLRGAFYSSDVINLVYTAVDNVTNEGCPNPKDYICHNLWCIDKDLMCDGVDHCGDKSDEVCSMPDLWNLGWSGSLEGMAAELTTLPPCHGHRCTDDKRCISPSQVCDGVFDCEDMTDEARCRYDYYSGSSSVRLSMKILSIPLMFLCVFRTLL